MEILIELCGALIGAAATVLAVWLTLRHERGQVADVAIDDAIGRLNSALIRLEADKIHEEQEARETYQDVLDGASQVMARRHQRYPTFSMLVRKTMQNLVKAMADPTKAAEQQIDTERRMITLVGWWWSRPRRFIRRLTPEMFEKHLALDRDWFEKAPEHVWRRRWLRSRQSTGGNESS